MQKHRRTLNACLWVWKRFYPLRPHRVQGTRWREAAHCGHLTGQSVISTQRKLRTACN